MKSRSLNFWLFFLACLGNYSGVLAQADTAGPIEGHLVWHETFDSANKGNYAAAPVTLSSGNWLFDDALIGGSPADGKNGSKSARIQKSGSITMLFDVADSLIELSFTSAVFGQDGPSSWVLLYSADEGKNWIRAGDTVTTTETSLSFRSFQVPGKGKVRFRISKINGGRLNIDDLFILGHGSDVAVADKNEKPTRDDNMATGNPSNAALERNNLLLKKEQYCLSYNSWRGGPNWVSWHLSIAWKGNAKRCNCFTEDTGLPYGLFRATKADYTNSGFDRGHLCPSDDRDASVEDNASTFLMDNMLPQAPNLNGQVWGALEAYCRTLTQQGNELYIIAGGYGTGGTGSKGYAKTIANGTINVPAHCWKVIIVLPVGSNDMDRISATTRVIAVDMPNSQSVNARPWGFYRTTTDAIEAATGYDILSNIPEPIQKVVEAKVDNGPTQ